MRSPSNVISARRSWRFAALIGTLLVGIAAVGVWRLGAEQPSRSVTAEPSANTFDTLDTTNPGVTFETSGGLTPQDGEVYLDGWTMRLVEGRAVQLQDAQGRAAALTFSPLGEELLARRLTSAPQVLADAFSRLITPEAAVTCDKDGCRDTQGKLALSLLADPTSSPTLGEMYAGWSITSGLYVAKVTLSGAAPYRLVVDGYRPVGLADPRSTSVAADEEQPVGEPSAADGYGRGTWYVSAGFGRLFHTTPVWGDEKPYTYLLVEQSLLPRPDGSPQGASDGQPEAGGAPDVPTATVEPPRAIPFMSGLGDGRYAATLGGLNAGQLTYLTSPVSGCSAAVTCAPTTLDVAVGDQVSRSITACDGDIAVTVTSFLATISVEVPHPIWMGGVNGDGLEGVGLLGWRLTPPLHSGPLRVTQLVLVVLDTNGMVRAVAGGRTGSDGTFDLDASDIAEFFNGRYQPC